MWYYTPVGGAIWGTGWAIYNPPWYVDAAAGAAVGIALSSPSQRGGAWLARQAIGAPLHLTGKGASKTASWIARTNAARSVGTAVTRSTIAVGIPVAAGYATSYAIGGKSGASDFHDYITGGVSPQKWWDTVTLKSMR